MATISINAPGATGFLYNNASGKARLCISAETPDFDTETLRNWRDEGFDVIYVPYDGDQREYVARLKSVKEGLGVGENYAVLGEFSPFANARVNLGYDVDRTDVITMFSLRRRCLILFGLLPETHQL